MATWSELLAVSAALLNDRAQEVFTNTVFLPYLNIARDELQEMFELNNIPVTTKSSAALTVPDGTSAIGFGTTPALPADLIEIQELWESQVGQENWVPVTKKEYLTGQILGTVPISIFGVWAWQEQEIRLLPANQDNDLKIDYIKAIFSPLTLGGLGATITTLNINSFLEYRVAGLGAQFVNEDKTKADGLNGFALLALDRSLGISIKGKQAIITRRRPFRAAYKRRAIVT
jgi:hypothetical protein